jgi:hypothetical protein
MCINCTNPPHILEQKSNYIFPNPSTPVTVGARAKAWIVFASFLDDGIVGSNLTQGMRLFCVCVILCLGSGLATGWSLVQEVLQSVKNDMELNKRSGTWMGWKSH